MNAWGFLLAGGLALLLTVPASHISNKVARRVTMGVLLLLGGLLVGAAIARADWSAVMPEFKPLFDQGW